MESPVSCLTLLISILQGLSESSTEDIINRMLFNAFGSAVEINHFPASFLYLFTTIRPTRKIHRDVGSSKRNPIKTKPIFDVGFSFSYGRAFVLRGFRFFADGPES